MKYDFRSETSSGKGGDTGKRERICQWGKLFFCRAADCPVEGTIHDSFIIFLIKEV